jgi:Nucleoside-diphosphate-sugar pyrophosphorylase involved in lipopolysaccharide biosynthesis/translation initiation factor 2B, gamma/epsilon subunits (eIF-2Bgamma/eIF-2Bepsilon)
MHDLTAVILCGGKGERLRPFTDKLPKPLVPLNGKPILHHLLRYLSTEGIKRFILCTGYKAEAIDEFAKNCNEPGWELICVNSGDVSMTDRLADASKHLSGRSLICYGDTLANVDVEALYREHCSSGARLTMTVYPLHSPFGIVEVTEDGFVTEFREKPVLPYWVNIGFMLCELEAIRGIRRGGDMVPFLAEQASSGALRAFKHNGKHLTINTEKERVKAESEIIEFFSVVDGQA